MNALRTASKSWRMLAVAAVVAAALGATAIRPALADDEDEGWGHGHHRGWYHHHYGYGYGYVYEPYAPYVVYPPAPVYTYEPPAYVYAPPPVVYEPAPVYTSPSINFVFPLHVR